MKKINWGIIGLGNISHKFCQGLLFSPHSRLFALASGKPEKEKVYRQQYDFDKFYSSFEELLNDKSVDAIYIATPNHLHFEQSKQALQSGKHVLCEKPVCLHPKELSELHSLAQHKSLFFMEALWTMFLPSIRTIANYIETEKYGSVRQVSATFGFKANYSPDSRLFSPKLGGGAIYDIGIYPIFLALLCMGTPSKSEIESQLAPTGCDTENRISLSFANGTAELLCSFMRELPNTAVIEFENAKIKIPAMWHCPQPIYIQEHGKDYSEIPIENAGNGYNYEAEHMAQCILQGKLESPIMPNSFTELLNNTITELVALAKK